jgi:hypothetical protein
MTEEYAMGARPPRKIPVKRKPPIKKSLKATPKPKAAVKKNVALDGELEKAIITMSENVDRLGKKIDKAVSSMNKSLAVMTAQIAASREETDAKMAASKAETDAKMAASKAETDAKIAEALAQIAASDAKIAASDARIAASREETDAKMAASKAETDAKIAASDAKMAAAFDRLDAVVESTKAELAGLSESSGRAVESMAYSFFDTRMTFAGVKFDEMETGVNRKKKLPDGTKVQGEYDIVLYNHSAIALIEAKNRVRKGDVTKLTEEQLPRFKLFFPQYRDFTFYLGLCGMSFEEGVEEEALDMGIGTLKPNGDAVEINEATVKAW